MDRNKNKKETKIKGTQETRKQKTNRQKAKHTK